jgi:hypothetical protein
MERRFTVEYRSIPGLGMRTVWRLTNRFAWEVVAISILAICLMAAASGRTFFDGQLKNLQPRHSEAFLV